MKKIIYFQILIFMFFTMVMLIAKETIIETNNVGNVFYENEKLNLKIKATPDIMPVREVKYVIIDVKNREVQKKTIDNPVFADLQTTPTLLISIPKLDPNYYTLNLSIYSENGKIQNKTIKISVLRKTDDSRLNNSPFAIDAFMSWRFGEEEQFKIASEVIHKAGITWVRDRFDWNDVEPQKGLWNFSKYDKAQEIQSAAGLNILQIMHATAAWASEKQSGEASFRHKFPPNDLFDVYSFFSKSSEHYNKYVKAWEVWNEFDIPVFFLGSADEYAEILKASSLAIEKTNPDLLTLFGSVTFGTGLITWGNESYIDDEGKKYIDKIFENGAADYFDIMNVHHYGPVAGIVNKIRLCKDIMKNYKCNKPIWITEVGSTATGALTDASTNEEYEQAEYLVKAYILALSEGVEKIFYFCFPYFLEHGVSNWGVFEIEPEMQPKPSYNALANMVNTLSGLKFIAPYKTDNRNIEGFIFADDKNSVLTLWSVNNTTETLYFDRGKAASGKIRYLYGKEIGFTRSAKPKITITKEPVFICFSSPSILNSDIVNIKNDELSSFEENTSGTKFIKDIVLSLRTVPEKINANTKEIKGKIIAYNFSEKPVSGDIKLYIETNNKKGEISTQSIDLKPFDKSSFETAFVLPEEIRKIIADSDEEIALSSVFKVKDSELISSPLKKYVKKEQLIEWLKPNFVAESGKSSIITVKFKALTDIKNDTLVEMVKAPSGYVLISKNREKITDLKNNEVCKVSFKFLRTDSSSVLRTAKEFEWAVNVGDFKFTRKDFFESGVVYPTDRKIIIDGKDDEWTTFPLYQIRGKEQIVHGHESYGGDKDCSAQFSLSFDNKALYIFARVWDESVMNDFPSEAPWTGDAVEIFIDLRSGKELGNKKYDSRVYQAFFIPPDENHPSPYFRVWQPDKTQWKNVDYKFLNRPKKGYNFEAKIPWDDLGISYPNGISEFGFDIVIDDMDRGGYEHKQMVWRGGADNWRDASLFPRLIFSEK